MGLYETIKKVASEKGKSINRMEKDLGFARSSISKFSINTPSIDKVQDVANYLNVSVDYLLAGDIEDKTTISADSVRIKVLGSVPAGIPLDAIEDVVGWEDIPKNWTNGGKEYFALKVKGNSMSPEYLDGDVIILRKQEDCDSGEDCVVYVGDYEATFKRVIKKIDHVILQPINSSYEPIMCEYVGDKSMKIAGVVVEMRRRKGNHCINMNI